MNNKDNKSTLKLVTNGDSIDVPGRSEDSFRAPIGEAVVHATLDDISKTEAGPRNKGSVLEFPAFEVEATVGSDELATIKRAHPSAKSRASIMSEHPAARRKGLKIVKD